MPKETQKLKLYKYDKVLDSEKFIDIDEGINNNWDSIDNFAGKVEDRFLELENEITSNFEKLKQESELLKTQFPTEIVEGKHLTLTDSSMLPFKSIEIEGETYQEVIEEVEGKEVTGESITVNDIELSKGKIGITGKTYQETSELGKNICPTNINEWESGHYTTEGEKNGYNGRIRVKRLIELKPNTEYNFNTFSDMYLFIVRVYDSNKVFSRSIGSINNTATFTTSATECYLGISIYNTSTDSVTFENYKTLFENDTIKPFICLNSETNKSYEEFIPNMPSIDYPSEVRGSGSEKGVNLYNYETAVANQILVDSTGILEGNLQHNTSDYIKVEPKEFYCFSSSSADTRYGDSIIAEFDKDQTFIKATVYQPDENEETQQSIAIQTSENTAYIRFSNYSNAWQPSELKIKFEKGKVATPYSPYGQGNISIIKNNNLEKTNTNYKEKTYIVPTQKPFYEGDTFIKKGGRWYEKHNIGKTILDETTAPVAAFNHTNTYRFDFSVLGNSKDTNTNKVKCDKFISSYGDDGDYEHCRNSTGEYNNRFVVYINKSRLASFSNTEMVNWLQENPITIYYPLETPQLIECTEEQTEILNELDNSELYIETTNINSTDENKPTLSLKYNYVLPSPSIDAPSEVKGCGNNINIFDGKMENGSYDTTTGAKSTNTTNIRNANPIEVEPNNEYIISNDGQGIVFNVFQYTQDMTFIKYAKVEANQSFMTEHTTQYINIFKGTSSLDKLKIEKGKVITPYSPYGQGNISVVKSNKNLAKIDTNYFELTKNNRIKNTRCIDSIKAIKNIKIKKGQVVKCRLKLFSKPTKSTSFTGYINTLLDNNEKSFNVITFANIQNYSLNTNYDRKWTATKDCELCYRSWGNQGGEIFEFELSISLDNFIDYVPHEEKTHIVPVQKPMYTGDYFDLKNNKEVHVMKKITLTGNENITSLTTKISNLYRFAITINNAIQVESPSKIESIYSNKFTAINRDNIWNLKEGIAYGTNMILIYSDVTSEMTVEQFKEWLRRNNVEVTYKLTTPEELPLTEEQKAVLKELQEDKNYREAIYVYSDDEIEPNIKAEYHKDTLLEQKTENERLQAQIDELKSLLNTTTQVVESEE